MYKKFTIIIIFTAVIISGCTQNTSVPALENQGSKNAETNKTVESSLPAATSSSQKELESNKNMPSQSDTILSQPITKALARITKKPFGIYITPKTSPIPNEKFRGYHTGTDFEVFPSEENTDVPVFAICDGKLLVAQFVSGYGGIIVQACEINNQAVTVLYGHIKLTSVAYKINDELTAGEQIAILGEGKIRETDNERKHLHLGIHKGTGINYSGYVQTESELKNWIDYESL